MFLYFYLVKSFFSYTTLVKDMHCNRKEKRTKKRDLTISILVHQLKYSVHHLVWGK